MNNYVITVLITSISIGVYNILAPKNKGLNNGLKMIGTLILLLVIISPIFDVLASFDGNFFDDLKNDLISDEEIKNEYNDLLIKYLQENSVEELSLQLKEILNKEFDIPIDESEISVITEINNDKIKLSKIQILLSGKSIFKNPYTIEKYFVSLLQCECRVLIKDRGR